VYLSGVDPAAPNGARPTLLRPGLACALALALGCAARLPIDRPWIEVRSENFVVSSDMSAEEAGEHARSLELFRAAVLALTRLRSTEASVPTHIFLFKSKYGLRPFLPQPRVLGYFRPTLRGNFVTAVDAHNFEAERVLRHEYVHFLLRNGSTRVYPRWFDEGYAELLSTAEVRGDYVAVGTVPHDRIQWIRLAPWIPLRRVLEYDGSQYLSRANQAMFYAESWALLHYLTRDLEHAKKLDPATRTYLEQTGRGADVDTASRAAFGMSTDELDSALRDYLQDGQFQTFGFSAKRLAWSDATHTRLLGPAEVAEQLGDLALAVERRATAEELFRAALAEEPDRPRAHAGLGRIFHSRKQWSAAESHLTRAVELDPEDPLNQLDLGGYWFARAHAEADPELQRELLARARRHIVRSSQIDGSKPEPYAAYGATFLVPGEAPGRGLETLEHAHRLLPSSAEVQMMLATAYLALYRPEQAAPHLERVLAWSHEPGLRDELQKFAEKLREHGSAASSPASED